MTAVYTGYDAKGCRWTLHLRRRPTRVQSRRAIRFLFEQYISCLLDGARKRGCTHIRRVVGARFKGSEA